jgi:hypothetical protein
MMAGTKCKQRFGDRKSDSGRRFGESKWSIPEIWSQKMPPDQGGNALIDKTLRIPARLLRAGREGRGL